MKFTKRTYRRAIRRSFNREYELFTGGLSTTSAWIEQMKHTAALERRQLREELAKIAEEAR
jgi:hypothetical protein